VLNDVGKRYNDCAKRGSHIFSTFGQFRMHIIYVYAFISIT